MSMSARSTSTIAKSTCECEEHLDLKMYSLRHDLRAALDEVGREITGVSATTDKSLHPGRGLLAWKCQKCGSFPAPGSKLRYCGLYKAPAYCGKACARADRAEHKLAFDSLRRTHSDALAAQISK